MRDDFLSELQPRIEQGQQRFKMTMQKLVEISRPDLFELLTACDNEPFLEPFAFLSFSVGQPTANLDQVFAGYLASSGSPLRLTVSTERDGSFYVPNLGYFNTDQTDSHLELLVPSIFLASDGNPVQYRLEPIVKWSDTSMELVQHSIALLSHCFVGLEGHRVSVDIDEAVADHSPHLAKALTVISEIWPSLYQAMTGVVRKLVLFRAEGINSFATTAAHGAAFINMALGDNEVFLVEDLAHQCGHVIFSAASSEAGESFVVAPSTPIGEFNGQPNDARSVYVVLHGVFTEALMAKCLDACLTETVFDDDREHELQGRLAFILRRFTADLRNISRSGILSSQGEELLYPIYQVWKEIMSRRQATADAFNLSSQGYNFCYQSFAQHNPITQKSYAS